MKKTTVSSLCQQRPLVARGRGTAAPSISGLGGTVGDSGLAEGSAHASTSQVRHCHRCPHTPEP